MKNPSRRSFLKLSAKAAGGAIAFRSVPAWAAPAAAPVVIPPLSQFEYSQVQLLEGLFRAQFDHNHKLFLGLDEDALLKPFRQREGMPAPGPDMGGWYDNANDFNPANNFHSFIAGHSFGQYVSGLARAYAVTSSRPTQEKVQRLVRAYAQTVDPSGKFYVDYRLPAYTFDKTSCGLIDAHEFAKDPIALDVLWKSVQAVLPYLPEKALSRAEQRARKHKDTSYTWDETYTLPENFFLAYQRSGGDQRYRDLAVRFIEQDYFGPLAEDNNVLPGEHAYSHVNALSSAMQAYLVLGEEKYLRAARNGLRMVQEQSYATGGWGPDEAFVEPGRGALGASLESTHASFETPCGAYGHFKITRYLLRVTRDSRYGDSMERVLYNTIGGARLIQPDGISFYYSDYNGHEAKKEWYRDKWPCCSGTFPQLTADYGISSYYPSEDGVYVNLFLPSKLTWSRGGTQLTLTQKTEYPKKNTIQLELGAAKPEAFTIYVRIPEWAGTKTILSVNGKRAEGEQLSPGKFMAVARTWKDGDRIEFEIEMPTRLEPVDDANPNTVALMRGPLALFAVGKTVPDVTREQLLAAASTQSSDDWTVRTKGGTMTLRSFAGIKDEDYRLYHKISS
ncbi:MAG TPA: beta-L-arabinofuranosidase domain-containing protein [Candidatus Acidoferrum sp.]|nr:beta-L-arabinofuranosidase domain-containing protein [Candidatus Acidoferrum sp.]